MKLKKIKQITYYYGDEQKLKKILYHSKEPLLIQIKGFPNIFTLDYFQQYNLGSQWYSVFDKYHFIENRTDDFNKTLEDIKQNKPYRIFSAFLAQKESAKIEQYVPLWQKIPFRPRFFLSQLKVSYFFGGRGSATDIHYDREHCSNLHLCLSGTKQLLLFTQNQSRFLYKVPYIGDSLIDFSRPMDTIEQDYPRLKQAQAYHVILKTGDMLFMPKNCWHYTRYLDASAAATYVFYPKKYLQFWGYFTGYFFLGYKWNKFPGNLSEQPLFKRFALAYAYSEGWKKSVLRCFEVGSYLFLLPIVSIGTIISDSIKRMK